MMVWKSIRKKSDKRGRRKISSTFVAEQSSKARSTKHQVNETSSRRNVKSTKCQVDEKPSRRNVKSTKCQVDEMPSRRKAKSTKCQVNEKPSRRNAKSTKCQVDESKRLEPRTPEWKLMGQKRKEKRETGVSLFKPPPASLADSAQIRAFCGQAF